MQKAKQLKIDGLLGTGRIGGVVRREATISMERKAVRGNARVPAKIQLIEKKEVSSPPGAGAKRC